MQFGPTSRITDILANPEARSVVEDFMPGFGDHPALAMLGGKPVEFLTTRHPALTGDNDKAARLWDALAKIEAVDKNRGKDVVAAPDHRWRTGWLGSHGCC